MTRVVHFRKKHDVYVGRPSSWGNPFKMRGESDRASTVSKYARWIVTQPALLARVGELKGKTLACWCSPRLCHGDVLVLLADGVAPDCLDLFI